MTYEARRMGVLLSILLSLVVATTASSQQLGAVRFVDLDTRPMTAPPLRLSTTIRTRAFVRATGGVAFDAVAVPQLEVADLTLDYDPDRADGDRLVLTINGERVAVALPDWQLLPIASFVQSGNYNCVTLFGQLAKPKDPEDGAVRDMVLDQERNGFICGYNETLEDTLLGLRILQLDLLMLTDQAAQLPTDANGKVILGVGEVVPDRRRGEAAHASLTTWRETTIDDSGEVYQSYIVSDVDQSIGFTVRNGAIELGGEPFYWCWRSPDRIDACKAVQARLEAAAAARGDSFSTREWYEAELRAAFAVEGFDPPDELAFTPEKELRFVLVEWEFAQMESDVIYMQDFSEALSSRIEELSTINPIVWESARRLMRYAAFFRYVRDEHPAEWDRLSEAVQGHHPHPEVTTPGAVILPGP